MTAAFAVHRVEPGLAAQLQDATSDSRKAVEQSPLMHKLRSGTLSRVELRLWLRQLIPIYESLELSMQRSAGDRVLRFFHDRRLNCSSQLLAELKALSRSDDLDPPLLISTLTYAERIREVSVHAPALLAHHYTRTSALLFALPAIRRIFPGPQLLAEASGLEAFAYLDRYHACLDIAPMTSAEHSRVVDEATISFNLSKAVLNGLAELSAQLGQPH